MQYQKCSTKNDQNSPINRNVIATAISTCAVVAITQTYNDKTGWNIR